MSTQSLNDDNKAPLTGRALVNQAAGSNCANTLQPSFALMRILDPSQDRQLFHQFSFRFAVIIRF